MTACLYFEIFNIYSHSVHSFISFMIDVLSIFTFPISAKREDNITIYLAHPVFTFVLVSVLGS